MRWFLLCLLCFLGSSLLGASTEEWTHKRIQVQRERQDLTDLIEQSKDKEWGVLETLKALDKNLGKKKRELKILLDSVRELETSIKLIEKQLKTRQRLLIKDADRLNQQLTALFHIQKVRHLTLFPGLSSYEDYFRNQRLLQKLSTVDAQLVFQLAEQLGQQQKQREELTKKKERLQALLAEQDRQRLSLATELHQQKSYLKQLRRDRSLRRRLLKEAGRELERINGLIESAKKQPPPTTEASELDPRPVGLPQVEPYSGLRQLKGLLDPPVVGGLVLKFKESRPFSGLYKKGVLVRTDESAQAKAVWLGRVVFAGGFRGFGEMVILDHGRGSFTVYGNLEEARVAQDQEVAAGTDLGQVAYTSGDEEGYLLYFEVRYHKRSEDPITWLKDNTWKH
ncbi:MAG: peptidoglycan DD-metalloendopeptidase family protein [bacterium]|nr:peptidoglycan DD-metalloendopeptidase family protein [bacterium]